MLQYPLLQIAKGETIFNLLADSKLPNGLISHQICIKTLSKFSEINNKGNPWY